MTWRGIHEQGCLCFSFTSISFRTFGFKNPLPLWARKKVSSARKPVTPGREIPARCLVVPSRSFLRIGCPFHFSFSRRIHKNQSWTVFPSARFFLSNGKQPPSRFPKESRVVWSVLNVIDSFFDQPGEQPYNVQNHLLFFPEKKVGSPFNLPGKNGIFFAQLFAFLYTCFHPHLPFFRICCHFDDGNGQEWRGKVVGSLIFPPFSANPAPMPRGATPKSKSGVNSGSNDPANGLPRFSQQ